VGDTTPEEPRNRHGLPEQQALPVVDYFNKLTSDILLPISLPSIVGNVSPTIVNAGEVSNKGFEVRRRLQEQSRGIQLQHQRERGHSHEQCGEAASEPSEHLR
jgi:hypothetical protein